jgi:hypothetical protein
MRLPLTLRFARRSASALSLALVLASSASGLEIAAGDAIAPSTNDRLSLTWFDAWGLCPLVVRGATEEVKRILSDLGVQAEWMKIEDAFASGRPRLSVVMMDVEPAAWGLAPHTLGASKGENGPRDVVFIFTPNVIQAAGHPVKRGNCEAVRVQAQVGRALARVIAHEIVHAVAPGHPHADEGLMNPSLSQAALLQSAIAVDPACARFFRSRLGR